MDRVEKTVYILLGLIIIAGGILTIKVPHMYWWGASIDHTGFNIPLGSAIIIMGVYRIWLALKGKK